MAAVVGRDAGGAAAVPLPIIYVLGATGTGKSDLALEVARWLRDHRSTKAEVINADAMQMYRGLPVATNHASPAEREEIPHHMLDFLDPTPGQEIAVTDFAREVAALVPAILERGHVPIVCGGSNYYVQAAMFREALVDAADAEGGDEDGKAAPAAATEGDAEAVANGEADALYTRLQEVDPAMAARYHPKDVRRIRRSLEVFEETGTPHSEVIAAQARDSVRFEPASRNVVLWVDCDRGTLYHRLDTRVDSMASRGVEAEVRAFCASYSDTHAPINVDALPTRGIFGAIGFKELIPGVLTGKGLADGYVAMKANTRRYAKQQVQWIRNRFCTRANIDVFRVDSSSKKRFRETAVAAAVDVVGSYLDGRDPAATHGHLLVKVERVAKAKHECALCDGVVLFGDAQVRAHNNSKRHRAAVKRSKRAVVEPDDARDAKRRRLTDGTTPAPAPPAENSDNVGNAAS